MKAHKTKSEGKEQ